MGRFSGVGSAEVSARKPYFETGLFKVRVCTIKCVDARKKGLMVFAECEVLESDNPKVRVGAIHAACFKMTTDSGPGHFRLFLTACMGKSPEDAEVKKMTDEQWEKFCELAVDEKKQPMAGKELRVQGSEIALKDGSPYTLLDWSPAEKKAA